jgi:hypothetical protein
MNQSGLETALLETGFAALFLYGERNRANLFWNNGANKKELEELVKNESSAPKARFMAAVILITNGVRIEGVAPLYALALKNTSRQTGDTWQLNGNLWSLLFEPDHVGFLGEQLVDLGNAAIPYLQPLLDDDSMIRFDGSEEATLGNAGRYRVKDFAAHFISMIRNIPLRLAESHGERDRVIEQLKTSL